MYYPCICVCVAVGDNMVFEHYRAQKEAEWQSLQAIFKVQAAQENCFSVVSTSWL